MPHLQDANMTLQCFLADLLSTSLLAAAFQTTPSCVCTSLRHLIISLQQEVEVHASLVRVAGETALTLAAGSGEQVTVQLLLEHGANISRCRTAGAQAIHTAAASGTSIVPCLTLCCAVLCCAVLWHVMPCRAALYCAVDQTTLGMRWRCGPLHDWSAAITTRIL